MPNSWAIVVGINEYGPLAGLRPLAGAVADAVDFADWLLDPAGAGVQPENLFFWTHPAPTNAELTPRMADFLQAPTQWPLEGPNFTAVPNVGPLVSNISQINARAVREGCERLYVFFAGHGGRTSAQTIAEEPQNCFVTGDFIKGVEAAGLLNCDDMKRYLINQGPAETIIFLDCCRNDLPLRILRPGTIFSNLEPTGLNTKRCIGRAAEENTVAHEVAIGPLHRGAFTQVLTVGLREIRDNGSLTLTKLEEFVTRGLSVVVKPPKEQIPDFDEKPRLPYLVLVAGPSAGNLFELTVHPSGSDPIDLVANDETVIRTIDPAAGPVSIPLALGSYTLERGGAVLKAFNHVGPGTPDVVL